MSEFLFYLFYPFAYCCQVVYEVSRQTVEENPVVAGPLPPLLMIFSGGIPLVVNLGLAITDYAPNFVTTRAVMRVFISSYQKDCKVVYMQEKQ